MAKEVSGGGTPKKKKDAAGYGFRFPQVLEQLEVRETGYQPRLLEKYRSKVRGALTKEYDYKNSYRVPTIHKVVLNIGLGEAIRTPKLLEQAFECLGNITGQRPVVTRAKKSIATFKLREGMKIGCMVTLRGVRMWEFLDRLISVALPRTRDFRGISRKAFDGRGNYTLGIKETLIFPEVDIDKLDRVSGLNICIHTSAQTNKESLTLLEQLGMPFRPA